MFRKPGDVTHGNLTFTDGGLTELCVSVVLEDDSVSELTETFSFVILAVYGEDATFGGTTVTQGKFFFLL